MAQNNDDLWDDDFDEADVEASILKASQMCLMPLNPPTTKTNSTSVPHSTQTVSTSVSSSFTMKKPVVVSTNTNSKMGTSGSIKKNCATFGSNSASGVNQAFPPKINVPKSTASSAVHAVGPLKVINEAEQMEIDALMEDPNIWDDSTFLDDPNVFDDQSPTKSSSNSQSQDGPNGSQNSKSSKVIDDQNFNKFFDSFDAIDPDLLSSQPIPGTQPRQRWQKNTNYVHATNGRQSTSNKYPAVVGSSSSKLNIVSNDQSCSSVQESAVENKSTAPPSKFARNASGDRVNATVFNSISSPSKGNQLPKQGQLTGSKGPTSTIGASQFFQAKHPHISSAHKPSTLTSTNVPIQKPTFSRRNSENLSSQVGNTSKFFGGTQAPSQFTQFNIRPDVSKINHVSDIGEEDLRKKLASSEQMIAQLQKEIMTKRGEVSCLRSELQRKTMTLDAERMARLGAADKHKKEMSEKVAAAVLESQSKCHALEKHLEKLHSDMAFKSREISELTTKCKRLEQGQMQQQKRHQQQQLQIYSQMVNSQEKQALTADQFQSPSKFLSPPAPGSYTKNPLNESRRFPRTRFDFSKDGPSVGMRSLQFSSPKSSATNAPKTSLSPNASLPKPQISPAIPISARQKISEDGTNEDELNVLSDVHLSSMFKKKGFYKASSESLSLQGDLSSAHGISYSKFTEDVLAGDIRLQLAKHLVISSRNDSVVFPERFNLAYTSVIKMDQNENVDSLCERDEERNYTDEIVECDLKALEIKPMAVKREKLLKKSPGSVTAKASLRETKDKLDDFNSITQDRASLREVYCSANAYCKELEAKQLCGEECPVTYQWSDEALHAERSCIEKDTENTKSNTKHELSSWSVKRVLRARDKEAGGTNNPKANKPSVLDISCVPQEWARLLSAMSQDLMNRKFENSLEDILDEEMNFAGEEGDVPTENNFIGFNAYDNPEAGSNRAFLKRERSAMMKKLGNFLYDLTQEMLEDNIRDLKSTESQKHENNNHEDRASGYQGIHSNVDNPSKNTRENSSNKSHANEEIDALLFEIYSPSRPTTRSTERVNATRELFHCVLLWLAEEAAYYRNVDKKLAPKRCVSVAEHHMKVMSSALIILKHLLPLRFSCQHLPSSMTVLAFLLYPLDITTSMALNTSVLLIPCLQESVLHPDSVMTPELAQLLVERLSRASYCATSPQHLTVLLSCLAAFSSDRTFVQSLCSLADECLVWRLCLRLLDFCDVVLPNGCFSQNSPEQPESLNSSSMTVRQVVDLMKTQSAANFYTVRNIASRSLEMLGPDAHTCIKAFYKWMVSVLLAKPAWLFSDCHCNIVLLATLLLIVHSQVHALVEGLPLIHGMKRSFCCHHHMMNTSDEQNSTESPMLNAPITQPKSSAIKKEASADLNSNKKSLVHIRSFDGFCGATNYISGDSAPCNNDSSKNLSSTDVSKSNSETAVTSSKKAVKPEDVETLSLTCSVCNSPTRCSGHCHCFGSCTEFFNVNAFNVHSACGCDCALVVSGLRVIKLYLITDPRSSLQTSSIPSYTLLTKLLGSALPYLAPLLQSDASKLLARLP